MESDKKIIDQIEDIKYYADLFSKVVSRIDEKSLVELGRNNILTAIKDLKKMEISNPSKPLNACTSFSDLPADIVQQITQPLKDVDIFSMFMAAPKHSSIGLKEEIDYKAAVLLSIVKHTMTHYMMLYRDNFGQYQPIQNAVTAEFGENKSYIFCTLNRNTDDYDISIRFSDESFLVAKYARKSSYTPYIFAYNEDGIQNLIKWLAKNKPDLRNLKVVGSGDVTKAFEYMTEAYQQIDMVYKKSSEQVSHGGTRKARVHNTTGSDKVLYKGYWYKIRKDRHRTFIQTKLGEVSMKEVKMHQKSMAKKDAKKAKASRRS